VNVPLPAAILVTLFIAVVFVIAAIDLKRGDR